MRGVNSGNRRDWNRRNWALAAMLTATAAQAEAQEKPAAAGITGAAASVADDAERARQRAKRTSELLSKISLPYDAEPQSRFEVL
jgi:hypothetical protein